jgi:hypothetical protein
MKRPVRKQPMGPKSVRGSDAARRLAALLLEAWSGVRNPQSAGEAMGVTVTRFYQLEARALQMLVSAMEPRSRGRQPTAEGELAKVRVEKQRLQRDVERYQSLYRTAQRSLGVVVAKVVEPTKNAKQDGKRRRRPRQQARGQAVAKVLASVTPPGGGKEVGDGTANEGAGSRGRLAGRPGHEVPPQDNPRHDHGAPAGGGGG